MNVDHLIDDMSAPASFAADNLIRISTSITDGAYLDAVAKLRKTVTASAKLRGVTDAPTVSFLQLGAIIHFCLRLAERGGRLE